MELERSKILCEFILRDASMWRNPPLRQRRVALAGIDVDLFACVFLVAVDDVFTGECVVLFDCGATAQQYQQSPTEQHTKIAFSSSRDWGNVKTYHDNIPKQEPVGSGKVAMEANSTILQSVISRIEQERSHVSTELRYFEEFRESVCLAIAEPPTTEIPSETTERLLETYKEVVMNGLDYAEVYGDSIDESLEEEFSPPVARILLSKKPLTQRRKRKLLRETAITIERRERFLDELDEERAALKSFSEDLAEIESALENLPECSLQQQSLEEILDFWEQYDILIERCEELLDRRQGQISGEEGTQTVNNRHTLNEYLYSELHSSYPVLSALANTLEQINSKRQQVKPSLIQRGVRK